MFKKLLFSSAIILSCCSMVTAQQFSQSAGLTGMVLNGDIVSFGNGVGNAKFTPVLVGITYFPRIIFPLSPSASVSAGLPITLGLGIINNKSVGIKGNYFGYDLPFVIDYNDAFRASENGDERLGFYLGAGFSTTRFSQDTIPKSPQKSNSVGILVRGGIRLGFSDDENYRGITIGVFHRIGFEFARYKTTGLSVLYEF